MSISIVILCTLGYLGLLFGVAFWMDRRAAQGRRWVNNPYVYALSMAVYCTAWTFYGSVGRATDSGIGFLPIYLGPSLLAPLWLLLLRKIIYISKQQRITSIADFLSARYGKSTRLGMLITVIAVVGVIPYISIQLKAIVSSFGIMIGQEAYHAISSERHFYGDAAFYITIVLTLFAILFGTRKLEPNERHDGMIAAIATESIVKLVAFVAAGLFVTYGLYDGFGDIFRQGAAHPSIARLYSFEPAGLNGWDWFWLLLISMLATLLLPRQFHVSVVENYHPEHLKQAMWIFPLYLLLINLFVLPIAVAGLIAFEGQGGDADFFILTLPLQQGQEALALLVYIGGASAATGMVIVEVIALSIMVSNNLIMPLLAQSRLMRHSEDVAQRLIRLRRLSIVVILLLAYSYFRSIGNSYTIVSIGLISFAAVAQFAPAMIGGVFWKRATKKGALAGIVLGFGIWMYTLPFPTLIEAGYLPRSILDEGLFGLRWLRPHAFLGLEGMDNISHAAFWSLFFNVGGYLGVSLLTWPSPQELNQADVFVNIHKYTSSDFAIIKKRADLHDLLLLLQRMLGKARADMILYEFEQQNNISLKYSLLADEKLIDHVEKHLAGAIGAASARTIIASVVKESPISLSEMMDLMEQTQEVVQRNRIIEEKSRELERAAQQLREANRQLRELDKLKAEFISSVTHELRTPITSIKALARILSDNPGLQGERRNEFLGIIVAESERVARLVSQVLDLRRIEDGKEDLNLQKVQLGSLLRRVAITMQPLFDKRHIAFHWQQDGPLRVSVDPDKFIQVLINLLSNAAKFCPDESGQVELLAQQVGDEVHISIWDNGPGIARENREFVFNKFTQVNDAQKGKPSGTGLGLYISRRIVERHHGRLWIAEGDKPGSTFVVSLPLLMTNT